MLVTVLVVAELIANGQVGHDADSVGVAFVSLWFLMLLVQSAATPWLMLLLIVMEDYNFPLELRLPTLVTLSSGVGAACFWWANPWIGAVCGLLILVGWLCSILDKLA